MAMETLETTQKAEHGSQLKTCKTAIISLYDFENNATRLLSAVLRREGFYVAEIFFKDWKNNFFEPPTKDELDNFINLLKDLEIGLVAISLRASAYLQVATQLTRLVQEKVAIPVLWGGTHVVLCPEDSIQVADMACIGEGEEGIVELVKRMSAKQDYTDIPNIWVRRGSEITRTPLAHLLCDLDSLPFRDYTSPDKYIIMGKKVGRGDPMIDDPVFQIMANRGCPYHCAYCYNSTLRKIYKGKGKYYRYRSVDSVIQELKLALKTFKNIKKIRFDDEVFNFDNEWVKEFHDKYPKEIGLPFECFTEPKLVELERFRKMKESGLVAVYMGIQNSFRITEELYDRNTPADTIKKAADVFHELGLDSRFQLILDDPLSCSEDKEELFKLLMSFERPFELYLFSLTVFPNTELSRKLLEDGVITEDQVEGKDTKTFRQLRVDLSYPRKPEDTYWAAMLVLLTKKFIPKELLWKFYNNKKLRENPQPLVMFAQFSNLIKMGWLAGTMLLRGDLTTTLIRRWLSSHSFITQ